MICKAIYVAVMLKVVDVVTLIESLYGDSSWRSVAVLSGRNELSPYHLHATFFLKKFMVNRTPHAVFVCQEYSHFDLQTYDTIKL